MNNKRFHKGDGDPSRGYIQVYTGNGKGKTTAALGLALRAAGAGLRTYIIQFIKSQRYSETRALERFRDQVVCQQYGRGCWIQGEPTTEDIACAEAGLAEARKAITSGEYHIVILDEVNVAISLRLLKIEDVLGLVAVKPQQVELVFTGRSADKRLIELADLVTEMKEVKHYYLRGVKARLGIEY